MTKQKSKVLKILLFLTFTITYNLQLITYNLFAQDADKLSALSKQIIESKDSTVFTSSLGELKGLYFAEHKYNECVELMDSLLQQKKELAPLANYYIALARYSQLKYLEETQNWDEYFSQGNAYREQITAAVEKAISSTTAKDSLHTYVRLIYWQFHKDQQDSLEEEALSGLMSAVLEYAKTAADIKPIKEAADKLLAYGEKGKSKELYRIYTGKLAGSDIKDEEIKNIALGFYQEGNIELAESLYDVYIDRLVKAGPKEKAIPALVQIARQFSIQLQNEGGKDAFYAEKVFKNIEELGGKEALDEELLYTRAFNLEKAKEFAQAKDLYLQLIQRFPQTGHFEEAVFKTGIIYTYILRDLSAGRGYFSQLTEKEMLSPQGISSIYQLGLLSQWEEKLAAAKDYYNKLLEKAKDGFQETVKLAKERMKEIEEAQAIEYNLKTFMDASLKEDYEILDVNKSNLSVSLYRPRKEEEVNISAAPHIPQAGCLQVEVHYLWSGHIGSTEKPTPEQPSFNTEYIHPATKEINLVVISPAGIVDRALDMLDVQKDNPEAGLSETPKQ